MNIREFAAKCGISTATASRILNRSREESQASVATYERVHRLATELGYRPNYAARFLHTHRSNCIGVVLGDTIPMVTMSGLRGITECAYKHDASLATAMCRSDLDREAEAFESMLYRGVDAIIWYPVFQQDRYDKTHIGDILKKYPKRLPVFSMSTSAPPGVFKFRLNSAEEAAAGAIRQLQCGCEKFGIIRGTFFAPSLQESFEAYRRTLEAAGVPASNIVEVTINDPDHPPQWELFRGVQGIWMYFVFALHLVLPELRRLGDLRRLHIDGLAYLDDWIISHWTHYPLEKETRFGDLFGSLQYHLLDTEKAAYRATEIVLAATKNPTMEPFDEPVFWEMPPSTSVPPNTIFF